MEMRAATREAKRLFMHGAGDGKRVVGVVKLSQMSGASESAIRMHYAAWEKEFEEKVANTGELSLALKLSAETLSDNKRDIAFIRDQIDQVKYELEQTEEITARLADWLDNFDGENQDTALNIFDSFVKGCSIKGPLRSQFIALKKLWDEKAGLDGIRDVALVREKEIRKGEARLAVKQLSNSPLTGPRQVSGIFVRKSAAETETETETTI